MRWPKVGAGSLIERATANQRRVFSQVVLVICRACGGECGPVKLDGKMWLCRCGEPLFGGRVKRKEEAVDAEVPG